MKFACFADTPLHVLNSVNFVWHDAEGSRGNTDLFIHKQFPGFDGMVESLRALGIFAHVYSVDMPVKSEESSVAHSIARMRELFGAKRYLAQWTGGVEVEGAYEILLMPAPLRFTVALYDVNRQADVWFYEDGLASYSGNLLDHYGPRYKGLLKKVFNKGHATVAPTRLYVNNVDACMSTIGCDILPLPAIDPADAPLIAAIESVFGDAEEKPLRKAIYLAQPLDDLGVAASDTAQRRFDETIAELARHADQVVVRPHPRERARQYPGLLVDGTASLWEMMCATAIGDDNVLVGTVSTAQLMPKLLFDKEPAVVFTYKLFDDVSAAHRSDIDELIERFKASYRNPEAVIVAHSMDEYRAAIEGLLG